MGTNYYAERVTCEACESTERLHVGKSSAGWRFLWQAHPGIESLADWRSYFKEHPDATLRDEYGDPIQFEDLVSMSDRKAGARTHVRDLSAGFMDSDGNEFSHVEFF